MSQKYDAFISYRHAPLDLEMAKKVHTGLETYHIPRSAQTKTGKKKMGRVFRDQEELPIGSDLDDNISEALASSKYLIVICSPRTPESYWVCKEIETFIEMHGREHILAVLIEGEPSESFPKALLVDDEGNPVEPLAADVRGETSKERNTRFKTEKLRLAAPIIGCTYDDLKQRHRERMIRRTVTIVSSIAAVVAIAGTAFGLYSSNVAEKMKLLANEKSQLADEKTKLAEEILAQYSQKQENQSRFYAEESLSLLKEGNREDAVLVAKAGLPGDNNDRPYVPESEYALSEALYAYSTGMKLGFDRKLSLDMTAYNIKRSVDKGKLVAIDSGYKVYVYDPNDWNLLLSIEPELDDYNYTRKVISADADESGVYVCGDSSLTKYDYSGNVIFTYDSPTGYLGSFVLSPDKKLAMLTSTDVVSFIDASSGKEIAAYANDEEYTFNTSRSIYDPASGLGICAHYYLEADHSYITLYDPEKGKMSKVNVSEGYVLDMCITPNDNIAVLTVNSDFTSGAGVNHVCIDLIDPDGTHLWGTTVGANVRYWSTFSTSLKAHAYDTAEGHRNELVLAIEDELFLYNEDDGSLYHKMDTRDGCVNLLVGLESSLAYIVYASGNVDAVDCSIGEMYTNPLIETDMDITNMELINGQAVLWPRMSSELYVLSYHEAPDLITLDQFDTSQVLMGTAPDSSYFVLSDLGDHTNLVFYDQNGQHVHTSEHDSQYLLDSCFIDNDFCFAYRDGIVIVKPLSGEEQEYTWEQIGIQEHVSDTYFTENGNYCVAWSNRKLYVIDMHELKTIYTADSDNMISKAIISEDGQNVYLCEIGLPVYSLNTSDGHRTDLPENMISRSESYAHDFIAISHDGKKLAMFCQDGMMRITDTVDGHTLSELPLTSKLKMFTCFNRDDSCLIIQGDDGKLRIWDINTQDYVGLVEMDSTVLDIIYDDENGMTAVVNGYGVYLLDNENYGVRAHVTDAVTYLSKTNMFVLRYSGTQLFMTAYKDYRTLLEEAAKQFPDSVLTDELKVKYNIE